MFATWSWGACCTFISQKGHWPLYCKKQVLLLGKAFICFFFSSSMFEVTLNFQFGFRLESKSEFFFSRESKGTFGLIQWRHSCFGSNTSHVLCLSGWSSLCFGLGFFFFFQFRKCLLKIIYKGGGGGRSNTGTSVLILEGDAAGQRNTHGHDTMWQAKIYPRGSNRQDPSNRENMI